MKLGDFSDVFLNMKDDSFVFTEGFSNVHSYRGYYDEVSFEPASDVALSFVKLQITSALNVTHIGYKGGEYNYDSDTPAHLAYYGCVSEESSANLEVLIGKMLLQYYQSH